MTHPSTAKLIKISNALLTQTKQGRLTWEPTEKLDVFEVNFPDYSIRIVPRTASGNAQAIALITGEMSHQIEIYNNEGSLIEVASSYEMKNEGIPEAKDIAAVLWELYELARRQAFSTDKALDELLSRLSSAA